MPYTFIFYAGWPNAWAVFNLAKEVWPVEEEFNKELEKGYVDMQAGRTKSAKKVFDDIHKDYDL